MLEGDGGRMLEDLEALGRVCLFVYSRAVREHNLMPNLYLFVVHQLDVVRLDGAVGSELEIVEGVDVILASCV